MGSVSSHAGRVILEVATLVPPIVRFIAFETMPMVRGMGCLSFGSSPGHKIPERLLQEEVLTLVKCVDRSITVHMHSSKNSYHFTNSTLFACRIACGLVTGPF